MRRAAFESVTANFDLDSAIDAEQWHAYVAAEAPVCGAGERHALGSETGILEQVYNGALGAVAFVSRRSAHGALRNKGPTA
jgi:hypothetical protein